MYRRKREEEMTRERLSVRCIPHSLVFVVAVGVLLLGASTAQAVSGANPATAFTSNGVSASVRAVQPAVSGLFQVHAPRAWVDALNESGAPGTNGVPDFLDSWDAFGARTGSAILKNGYAFTTIDGLQHEVLYAGVQRESAGGPSSAVLEFSQKAGERTLGDLRISIDIDAAGGVETARFETFADEAKGTAKFFPVALLAGEGCNDAGSACVITNGALLEMGYNLTALGKPGKAFSGIQITTPEDSVVGTFAVNPVILPTVDCPSNLRSCTANDVTTTVKNVEILAGDACNSTTDTIRLRITTAYASTSNSRFDLGLFVSKDGGTVQEPSSALACSGAAAQVGQGDNLAYPDADTDLFLDLDPSGHSSTPNTADTCGDLLASAGPVNWTVDATVECKIADNVLRIPSCRVWEQNANHKVSCQTLQQAGTGSKCDCTDLIVTAQLNPCATTICNDGNACTVDHCRVVGTAPNQTAECYTTPDTGATCDDGDACTTGTTCQSDGTCGGSTGQTGCDDGDACTTDRCNTATGCTHTAVSCDDGDACTTDGCNPASGCTHTAVSCNDGDACTTDGCNPASGCTHTAVSCNDGDACTTDGCNPASGCTHTAVSCDDSDACTTDGCNPASGCTHSAVSCNDGNVCTDDSCNPASGCVYTNNSAACIADDNQCTKDQCVNGVCTAGAGGTKVIPENYICTAP
jgi:Dictyostelium (slime mold) repeat